MEFVIILVLLMLAAFGVALLCGIIAFVRTGDISKRLRLLESELTQLRRRLNQMAVEDVSAPQPAHQAAPSESQELQPSASEASKTLPQTPPPVPKTVFEKETIDVEHKQEVREETPAAAPPTAQLIDTAKTRSAAETSTPSPKAPSFDVEVPERVRDLTKNLSLEMLAGTKGLLWAGVITLVVGVAFFLKYLYDLGIIDERMRLAIAVVAGAIALGLGERFRRKDWAVISQGFTGLGIGVFYVCVYFSFQIYELTGQTTSFVLACGVTALATALAVYQNAPSTAVLAVIGGFLSPVFISTGENHPYILFTYIALLDMVAVGVASFKRWRFLDALCFAGTVLLYLGWYFTFFGKPNEPDMTLPATLYASLFYVLFLGTASLHSLVRRAKSRPEDLIIAALNAAFWFFAYYNVLYTGHRHMLGGLVVGQAALVFLVFLAWWRRVPEDKTAHAVLLVLAMGLSVLAVPILLRLYAYQIAWAVQGAVFVYLGYRYRHDVALGGGIIAWTLGAGALFRTLPLHKQEFIPVFNQPFGSWVCVIAAGVAIAFVLNRYPDEGRPWRIPAIGFVSLAGLGLTCLLLTFETALFWTTRGYENYRVYQHSSLAVLWALIPFAVMAFLCQKRLFNWMLVAVVCYCIALVFWFLGLNHYRLTEPWMFVNTSFLARLVLVGSLAGAAVLVFRAKGEPDEKTPLSASSKQLTGMLALVSYLMGAFLLTLEVWTFWELRKYAHGDVYQAGCLNVLWAAIALATTYVICRKRLEDWMPLAMAAGAFAVMVFLRYVPVYAIPRMYMFLNVSFALRLPVTLSLAAGAWLLYRADIKGRLFGGPSFATSQFAVICALAAYAAAAVLLTADVWNFWEIREAAHQYNHQYGSLVLLWAIITLITAAVLYAKRIPSWTPVLVSAYGVGVFIFFLSLDKYQIPEAWLILNTTYLARLALPLSLWIGAYLLRKLDRITWSDVTTIAGHVVFAVLSAFELWYWSKRTELVSEKMAQSFISSAWGLQAFALIVIGMVLRSRTQRLLGLAFFAITIGKVWLLDLSSVEPLYRILSFIGLGLLLLPASVLYQRFSDMLLGERQGEAREKETAEETGNSEKANEDT